MQVLSLCITILLLAEDVSLETGDTTLCQLLLQDLFGGDPQVRGDLPVAQNLINWMLGSAAAVLLL